MNPWCYALYLENHNYTAGKHPSCKFFGKTYGMERSISVSELSAENGVAVVMLMGRLLETTKITSMIAQWKFVGICTSPQWKFPLFGLELEKMI